MLVVIPLGFVSPTRISQFVSPTNRQLAIQIATLAFSAVGLLRRTLLSISAAALARCWRENAASRLERPSRAEIDFERSAEAREE